MRSTLFLIACLSAGLSPILPTAQRAPQKFDFPGWPTSFEGRILTMLPLTERERQFEQDYPGKIGRFNAGEREVVLRFVAEKTRQLHPSAECFKAIGYVVEYMPIWIDKERVHWGCFNAWRGNENLWVYECIRDNNGNAWSDVSAWYWSALLNDTKGPWWAVTVAEARRRE